MGGGSGRALKHPISCDAMRTEGRFLPSPGGTWRENLVWQEAVSSARPPNARSGLPRRHRGFLSISQDIPATSVPRSAKLRSGDTQSLNRERIDDRDEFEIV